MPAKGNNKLKKAEAWVNRSLQPAEPRPRTKISKTKIKKRKEILKIKARRNSNLSYFASRVSQPFGRWMCLFCLFVCSDIPTRVISPQGSPSLLADGCVCLFVFFCRAQVRFALGISQPSTRLALSIKSLRLVLGWDGRECVCVCAEINPG